MENRNILGLLTLAALLIPSFELLFTTNNLLIKILSLLNLAALVATLWFMEGKKSKIKDGQTVNDSLTMNEKLLIWVFCFFDPIISGAIFYFGWKKKMPLKAKQANTISFAAFGILIILGIIYVVAGGNIEVI